MANQFKLIGHIRPMRENTFETKAFTETAIQKRVKFMMVCGDNTQYLEASTWVNTKKNPVYTFSKGDAKNKGQKMTVEWDKRFDPAIVDSVANYKKWVIDSDYSNRKALKEAGDKEALAESLKKRHEFIAQEDFVEFLNKLVTSDKIKDMTFQVVGEFKYNYSPAKNQWYKTMEPMKIYRLADDTEPVSEGTFDIFYTAGAVDSESEEETGKSMVNAYVQYYDSMIKGNAFTPMSFVLHNDCPKAKGFKMIFGKAEEEKVYKLGVTADLINGSTRVEVSESMLSDEQKELLSIGMITLDDIREEYGFVRGDKVTENALTGLSRGYSKGAEESIFEVSDLQKLPIKEEPKEEDTEVDLFDEDDDDLI